MKLNMEYIDSYMAEDAASVSKKAALRMSEAKWEAVVFAHLRNPAARPPVNASTCSLCHRYNITNVWGGVIETCEKCPLAQHTHRDTDSSYDYGCGENYDAYCHARTAENAIKVLNDIRGISKKKPLDIETFRKQLKQ